MPKATGAAETLPEWRDPHKGLWLSGLIIPLTPFLAWGLVSLLGPGVFWAAGLLVVALIPSIDRFYGPDRTNPPDEVMKQLENSRYYRWCLFPYIPLQYAGLVLACYLWTHAPMGIPERIALATTSRRMFHSGDPGDTSGRQRLQARKPARWAAAAVG